MALFFVLECDARTFHHGSVKHSVETEATMDIQDFTRLVARARANRIMRQAQKQSAAQVLKHQDGSTPENTLQGENRDATPLSGCK